jgi:site-specific DNA-cytosine methylase
MSGINVLSFFDGVSAGQEALRQLGVPVANYFAIEIDEAAIKVTQSRFPNTIQVGNITHITEVDDDQVSSDYTFVSKITGSSLKRFVQSLPPIDLVFAGSPCQGFSQGGKSEGFEDPRSRLFFNFIQIFNAVKKLQNKPNLKFFFENVKMKAKWSKVITNHLKVEPIKMLAHEYSPCARKRYYWTNLEMPMSIVEKYRKEGEYQQTFLSSRDYKPSLNRLCYFADPSRVEKEEFRNNNIYYRTKPTSWAMCGIRYPQSHGWRVNRLNKPMPCLVTKTNGFDFGIGVFAFPSEAWSKEEQKHIESLRDEKNMPVIVLRPSQEQQFRLGLKHSKYYAFHSTIEQASFAMGFPRDYFNLPNNTRKEKIVNIGNSWSVTTVKRLIEAYCTRKGWVR